MKKTKKNTTVAKSTTAAKNTKTNTNAKAKKASKTKTSTATAATPNKTRTGPGRPAGTGNRLVSLRELVEKMGEDAQVPVITNFLNKLGLSGEIFATNKKSISELVGKYVEQAPEPAATPAKSGATTKVDLS